MITLDAINRSLVVVLDAAPVAELDVLCKYDVYEIGSGGRTKKRGAQTVTRTNGATPVTVIPAPDATHEHELTGFDLVQVNVADVGWNLKYDISGVYSLVKRFILSNGDNLGYE